MSSTFVCGVLMLHDLQVTSQDWNDPAVKKDSLLFVKVYRRIDSPDSRIEEVSEDYCQDKIRQHSYQYIVYYYNNIYNT